VREEFRGEEKKCLPILFRSFSDSFSHLNRVFRFFSDSVFPCEPPTCHTRSRPIFRRGAHRQCDHR
jgi:hypothetical protein